MYCKLVHRGQPAVAVRRGHPVARIMAVNVRDLARFKTLFGALPPTVDPSVPPPPQRHQPMETWSTRSEAELLEHVRADDANFGQLSAEDKQLFTDTMQGVR